MIGLRKQVKKTVKRTDSPASNQMSVAVIVRMLPNRNADRSGAKAGERKLFH